MRTSFLLLTLAGGAISLSIPACGGKLTDAETRYNNLGDAASTSGGPTTGGGGGDGSAARATTRRAARGGRIPHRPHGGSGAGTGSGGTTGSGRRAAQAPAEDQAIPGARGGGGGGVDAGAGCPENQPSNGTTCAQLTLICSYDTASCACTRRAAAAATSATRGDDLDLRHHDRRGRRRSRRSRLTNERTVSPPPDGREMRPKHATTPAMKTVLVTGANRGIGLELCRCFRARGDAVIGVCRTSSPELSGPRRAHDRKRRRHRR